jgi:hypothetical protein
MKFSIQLILVFLILHSCKKNYEVQVDNVIYNLRLSPNTGLADGRTIITVSVNLSRNADISKRSVIFTISPGNFLNGQGGTVTVPAALNGDSIIATATFISPSNAGVITVRAMPNIPDSNKYVLKDSVVLTTSSPAEITLQTSSYGLRYNFQSEDTIIGIIKNISGKGISTGVKVLFEDSLLTGMKADGKYRQSNVSVSNGNSQVSTIYSNGVQSAGVDILVRGTVLNEAGQKTNITDSIILKTIN